MPRPPVPNQMGQTDVTNVTAFKVIGGAGCICQACAMMVGATSSPGKLSSTMHAEDVTDTLDLAKAASGGDQATVMHKPRLLGDNGPGYLAGDLTQYIEAQRMTHMRGAPHHPRTQGNSERRH